MPVKDWVVPDHLIAEWNSYDEDGMPKMKSVSPEDILPLMAEGYTVQELADHFGCPSECIEHVIACIPEMMVHKSMITPQSGQGRRLPRVQGEH